MDNKYKAEIVNLPDEFSDYQINFKVIVIGNTGVGKTCITNQAIKGYAVKQNSSLIKQSIQRSTNPRIQHRIFVISVIQVLTNIPQINQRCMYRLICICN